MTYRTAGVRRLFFIREHKFNYNHYTIGSGVGAKSRFVRSNLNKNAAKPYCCGKSKLNTKKIN